jgi:hypothetical protein
MYDGLVSPPKTPFESIIDVCRLPDAVNVALDRDRRHTISHGCCSDFALALVLLVLDDILGLPMSPQDRTIALSSKTKAALRVASS